jgi:hypothetical protein
VPPSTDYPRLIAPGSPAVRKVIKHDGAGQIGLSAGQVHDDTGLGGAPLRIMPGASGQVVLMASSSVPDDTTSTAGFDVLGPTVSAIVTVTPRYSLWSAP